MMSPKCTCGVVASKPIGIIGDETLVCDNWPNCKMNTEQEPGMVSNLHLIAYLAHKHFGTPLVHIPQAELNEFSDDYIVTVAKWPKEVTISIEARHVKCPNCQTKVQVK